MELANEVSKTVANQIKKLNPYTLPQYAWLIILYYLMLNVFLNYYLYIFKDLKGLINVIPQKILKLNSFLMSELDKWIPFVLFLSIAFFLSGIIISIIRHLPKIESYKFSNDGVFGIELGKWLFLIVLTYYLYDMLGGYFIFVLPVILVICEVWSKIKKTKKNTVNH